MDKITIVLLIAVWVCICMMIRVRKLQKDLYQFTEQMDQIMDCILSDRPVDLPDITEDTLIGKMSEKFSRVCHIWEKKQQEIAEEKKKMKELIADISHQTKTPIANQKIYLEILQMEQLPEQAEAFVRKLEHQTDKLEFLFQSMVKVSRLETGIIQIRKQKGNITEAVRNAVASILGAAEEKRIRIHNEITETVCLPYDKKWTEEAIMNILDNAVKYTMEEGDIFLYVRKGEIYTELHIKDTGKGIATERQAQIFTRFYREPEVHEKEGLGIGLYISRTIVEQQNGYIEVASIPGKGADFCICLPNQ